MEPQWAYVAEGIAGGLGFLGVGIAAAAGFYSYFRYRGQRGDSDLESIGAYEDRLKIVVERENSKRHTSCLEQRASVATALIQRGAGSEEITTFLNNNFPFQDPVDPDSPPTG